MRNMSTDFDLLHPDALKLINEGGGGEKAFRTGKPSKLIAVFAAGHIGPLTKDERTKLAKEHDIGEKAVGAILTKLKQMSLWDGDRGGLGRKDGPFSNPDTLKKIQGTTNPGEKNGSTKPPSANNGNSEVVGAGAQEHTLSGDQGQKQPISTVVTPNQAQPSVPAIAVQAAQGGDALFQLMIQTMKTVGDRLDRIESKSASDPSSAPQTVPPPIQQAQNPTLQQASQQVQQAPTMQPQVATGFVQQPAQPISAPAQMPSQNPQQAMGQLDFFTMMKFIQSLPPEQKRLYFGQQAAEKAEDPMLKVFQSLDSDHAWVDIMEEQGIGFEDMQRYLEKYNTIKKLSAEKENLGTPYLAAWYDACRLIGENMRRGCQHFNEPDGTCLKWALEDIPKAYRETYRGMYRSMRNKEGYLFNVERAPEICAVCQRAKLLEGEQV